MRLIELYEGEEMLPQAILAEAARRLSQIAWATEGFMDICRHLRADGYLTDTQVAQAARDSSFHRSSEFIAKFQQWSEDEVKAVFDRLQLMFSNDGLTVWREITAPADWRPDADAHPGLYWSWDKDAADAHWGGDREVGQWLLQAHVTFDQIDWLTTLAQNAALAYSDEKEIKLLPTAQIVIDRYERR